MIEYIDTDWNKTLDEVEEALADEPEDLIDNPAGDVLKGVKSLSKRIRDKVKKVLNQAKKDIRNGEVVPNDNYCAEWRDSSNPHSAHHRKTLHSRLGADSVKARLAAKVGADNVISVRSGACK